jgi:hypothetical protein
MSKLDLSQLTFALLRKYGCAPTFDLSNVGGTRAMVVREYAGTPSQ